MLKTMVGPGCSDNIQHAVDACVLGTTSSVETSETWPRRSETWMIRTASELSAHIGYWRNCTRYSSYYPSPTFLLCLLTRSTTLSCYCIFPHQVRYWSHPNQTGSVSHRESHSLFILQVGLVIYPVIYSQHDRMQLVCRGGK